MDWLTKLERKFGRFGVPDLILWVVVLRALAYVIGITQPWIVSYLVLDAERVKDGEVWRLLTFVFTPPRSNVVFAIFELYVTYMVGSALEAVWGEFRFTLYYLVGTLATAFVAFAFLEVPVTPFYLNLSVFLAFATVFPDFTFLAYFVLPVKAKYLGWLAGAVLTYEFWSGPLSVKLAIVTALSNYTLFFWPRIREWMRGKLPHQILSRDAVGGAPPPVHQCTVCGRTERQDPELEFRVCSCAICGEGREFCMEHLRQHRGDSDES